MPILVPGVSSVTSTLDIIQAAMRRANLLQKGETAPAEDAEEALLTLNMMMHGWKSRGADIGHSNLALNDAFSMGAEFHEGAVYLLASRLATEVGVAQPTADGFDVAEWWDAIQAAYTTISDVTLDRALTEPPSRVGLMYEVSSS